MLTRMELFRMATIAAAVGLGLIGLADRDLAVSLAALACLGVFVWSLTRPT